MTPEQLDLFEQLETVREKITQLREYETDLENQIRASFDVGPVLDGGGTKVATIQQGYQFDRTRAQATLSPELLKLISDSHPDPKRAKKLLPPELYEKCLRPIGKPKIKIESDES